MDLRKYIRGVLLEFLDEEGVIDEERITNKKAAEEVRSRKNFVASHTYGEDIGSLGQMYVAYSYGEQHPLYVWNGEENKWYYNYDDYILPDGSANIWTRKHLKDLQPTNDIHGRPTSLLKKMIHLFKQRHGIGDNVHTDLEPGEK